MYDVLHTGEDRPNLLLASILNRLPRIPLETVSPYGERSHSHGRLVK